MDTRMAPDFELAEALTFDTFYRAEHEGQLRRAYLMLGSEADAYDAVATAFTAVYQRWDTLDLPGPYLNRAVLNACRDVGRSRRKLRPVDGSDAPSEPASDFDGTNVELADSLRALPHKQRAVVVLRHYVGMSEREIAEALDIAPGSVGPTLHRAHKKLKEILL